MPLQLPKLPYLTDALEPYISEKTVTLHYHKHHAGYLNNLNKLIENTSYESMELEEIIIQSNTTKSDINIFNNAAQVYNHNILWLSMSPEEENRRPSAQLEKLIIRDLSSIAECVSNIKSLAVGRFGSGWAWLCLDPKQKKLHLTSTSNAQNPLTEGLVPLLCIDVWEHAYYIDYQNLRVKYVDTFFSNLANWSFASTVLAQNI